MAWDERSIEILKSNWKTKTASQIAELIGGVSRNAVIGKANRLNLSAKIKTRSTASNGTSENSIDNKNTKIKRGRRSKFKSLIIDKDFEPENPKQLEELEDGVCRYPIGHPDEKDFYFCGRTSVKDFSYCKLHLLYSYVPKGKKEETNDKEDIQEYIEKKIQTG